MNPIREWRRLPYRQRRLWWLIAAVLVFVLELGRELIRHDDNVSPLVLALGFWCFAQWRWHSGWRAGQRDEPPFTDDGAVCDYCGQAAKARMWASFDGLSQTILFCNDHAERAGTDVQQNVRRVVYGRQDPTAV